MLALLKKTFIYSLARRMVFFSVESFYIVRKELQILFCNRRAVMVLYHRIDNVSHDPTLLCVTPATFEQHLQFYKRNYNIIPLAELVEKIKSKALTGNELVLTFDDGYQDNLTNALPLLEKYNLPAAIFITTGYLGQVASFAWDKQYTGVDRAKFLAPEEIKILARHPLITIGAHTVNHTKLATANNASQEILNSKKTLEIITDQSVNFFAYPFGGPLDFTRNTETLTKEAGFISSVANNQLFVTSHSRLTAVPRINIRNYTIAELSAILK